MFPSDSVLTTASAPGDAKPFWLPDPAVVQTMIQGPMQSCFRATLESQRILADATMQEVAAFGAARRRMRESCEQMMACRKMTDFPAAYAAVAMALTSVAVEQTRLTAELTGRLGGCYAQNAQGLDGLKGH